MIIVTFLLFNFIFFHLAANILQVKPDGWYVGHVNLYGDLLIHLAFINRFLNTETVIVGSPIFAGDKPNYPIFADLVTAQIAKVTDVQIALFLSTVLGGLLVVYIARLFILNFIKNERIVFMSLLLFFINGGLGFYYFLTDFLTSDQSFTTFITHLPRQYTDIKDLGFWWINNYLAYFLPQRGFLFAFPITLITLLLLYKGAKKESKKYFIIAGILAGLLPLTQAHSLFLIFLLSIFYAPMSIFRSKNYKQMIINWGFFGTITTVLALLMFNSISSGQNPLKFIRFDPGWTSEENIIWFWFKNLGLFAPMLLISLIWLFKKNIYLFKLYIPFLIVFLLCNLFIFQPWDFDNSKLLIYWFFASTIVVAYYLEDQLFQENFYKKILGVILIFFMIFAGSLDIFRTFTQVTNYQIFSKHDLEAAQAVKNLTPKDSIFITAFNHNHPIPSLTGRSTLLGYEGWIWSHGLNYQQRKADVLKIYLGGHDTESLIKQYKIGYVTIGPQEKATFSINESYFAKFPKINLTEGWNIYDVSNLWANSNR